MQPWQQAWQFGFHSRHDLQLRTSATPGCTENGQTLRLAGSIAVNLKTCHTSKDKNHRAAGVLR